MVMHTSKYKYADNITHFYLRGQLQHVNALNPGTVAIRDAGVAMYHLNPISAIVSHHRD